MAARTFYTYIRVNGVLTNADGTVTIKVKDSNDVYVVGSALLGESMTNISTGTYEFISGDVFTVGVQYTVIYEATVNSNNYSYSEVFTVDSASNQLFSLAELKQELKITTTDYDVMLTLLVDAVPKLFEEYLDRKINSSLNSEKFYNEIGNLIFVQSIPVTSVIGMTRKVLSTGETSTTAYTIMNLNFGEFKLDDPIEEGEEVAVNYVGGLIPESVVKYAGLTQAKYMYQRHQHQQIALDSNAVPQGRMVFKNDAVLPIVKLILDPLRRMG